MKGKLAMFLTCLFMWAGLANAQTKSVTGVVISEDDGQPIIGASVVVTGHTGIGTATDIDGRFILKEVPSNAKTLTVSYVGMETQVVSIKSTMKIALSPNTKALDEVVVTAMGITRSQKTLGYSASTIKNDEISKMRNTNAIASLSGKVAGLQVQSTSSDPGAANSVIIRGFSSINGNNQPLYVVDGVPLQTTTISGLGHSTTAGGISNISPDDIAEFTVLKGAAATALYGSRAANGVIVITTKQGKKGDGRNFNIEYNGGIQARQVSLLPDFQNDFGQGWNGKQTFIENGSWGPRLDGSTQVYGPIWNGQQLIHNYSAVKNNVKEFFDIGMSQNHNVALSGVSSDSKMTYYLSYGFSSDDGIMPTNADKYTRNTIGFRSSYQAADWIKFSTSINHATSATNVVGSFQGTSVIDGLYEMPRDVSIVDMKDLSSAFNTPEAYFTPTALPIPTGHSKTTTTILLQSKPMAKFRPTSIPSRN